MILQGDCREQMRTLDAGSVQCVVTTGIVAGKLGRKFIGVELNEDYCQMARASIVGPLFGSSCA